eukprot:TRINITY_DN84529_c0_g1_i1.p1 TRINITY_DN84529_c0_g1~~TRINITY_DN84529_c0_g1_i1.p1  ORF type:complete len:635 (-),score=123.57 TRINITY_DN84529_c0_g1_i1:429-2171(-)
MYKKYMEMMNWQVPAGCKLDWVDKCWMKYSWHSHKDHSCIQMQQMVYCFTSSGCAQLIREPCETYKNEIANMPTNNHNHYGYMTTPYHMMNNHMMNTMHNTGGYPGGMGMNGWDDWYKMWMQYGNMDDYYKYQAAMKMNMMSGMGTGMTGGMGGTGGTGGMGGTGGTGGMGGAGGMGGSYPAGMADLWDMMSWIHKSMHMHEEMKYHSTMGTGGYTWNPMGGMMNGMTTDMHNMYHNTMYHNMMGMGMGMKHPMDMMMRHEMPKCRMLKCHDPNIRLQSIRKNKLSTNPLTGSNSVLIYDDNQVILVDPGIDANDANQAISQIQNLRKPDGVTPKEFKGTLLTHAHPHGFLGTQAIRSRFPNAPIYTASKNIKNQILHILPQTAQVFGANNAGVTFDYKNIVKPLEGAYDLWGNTDVRVIPDMFELAETAHFTILDIPSQNAWVVGDAVYDNTHLLMGQADLGAQCDWMAVLQKLKNMATGATKLYTSHGAGNVADNRSAKDIIEWNMQYLRDARAAFTRTCNRNDAVNELLAKYPNAAGQENLQLGANARVPADATQLGCCVNGQTGCSAQRVPPCNYW